jgi:hypothetical protein
MHKNVILTAAGGGSIVKAGAESNFMTEWYGMKHLE